ncbi:hypothetical protein [Polynucleobacter necessarius]|uniref:hypothetical protein n=1 Tax=Polynucleobacter necessarius TaxID=576610 RepID=UPI0013B06061|nr:hypothetical protein [Polynucleobacter necessarius]
MFTLIGYAACAININLADMPALIRAKPNTSSWIGRSSKAVTAKKINCAKPGAKVQLQSKSLLRLFLELFFQVMVSTGVIRVVGHISVYLKKEGEID